ncbi:hypothetical protein [Streptomyces flaveus]|uniref:hypothetical protein n=1 Tax=Streptomyces flaveus TaxID=66370 RepID=UPI00333006B8
MTGESGSGQGIGGDAGFAEALGGLSVGAEPPMPDLVPGAVKQGVRIRRRRIGVALGTAMMVVALAGGGAALTQGLLGGDDRAAPAPPAAPDRSVRYPSLELLRSVVPASTGTVRSSDPGDPPVPGRYFLLTTDRGTVDLYVAVGRTTVTRASAGSPTAAGETCADSAGRLVTSPWDSFTRSCETTRTGSGGQLLSYVVSNASPAPTAANDVPVPAEASGVSYLTPDGWTVQVITGDLGTGAPLSGIDAQLSRAELSALATDPRLFGATTATGP